MIKKEINIDEICDGLKNNGYYFLDSFLNDNILKKISDELNLWNVKLNSNKLSPVYNKSSLFYSNALASSKTLFDIITNDKILNISKTIIGNNFRLKAHRVYNLQKNYKFPWHTDNKSVDIKNDSDGIVFIIYMDDVEDGETQVIRGSHIFSHKYKNSNLDNSYVQKKYGKDVVSLKGKRGSAIIFDQKIIHRGKPISNNKTTRSAIFFQIDNNVSNAERLLLNSEFLELNKISNYSNFLGFGQQASFPVSPDNTSLKTVPPKKLINILIKIPFWIINYYTNLLIIKMPYNLKNKIKNFIKK